MKRIICEKTLFNILFYRKHKKQFNLKLEYPNNTLYKKNTSEWIVGQSNLIDKMGFDNWYKNTEGPLGVPKDIPIRNNPFFYKLEEFK